MKKIEQNQQSVLNLNKFLHEIIQTPADFVEDESLRKALNSQGGLAGYENTNRGITPCVLNTQKKNADEVLLDDVEGGYDGLDARRRSALQELDKERLKDKKSNKSTKTGLAKRVSELEEELAIAEKHNLMMVALLSNLKETASNFAQRSGDSQLQADWLHQRKSISAKVSFINNKALLKAMSDGKKTAL